MTTDILRVAAYARVSTDKDDQANSLTSQRTYFADYITYHHNWKLSNIYYDEGISGTQTKKRDGFNQMIDDAMNGELDLIITKEVSRFARNTVDTLTYTRNLKDLGIGVIFTIDNIDTRESDGELRLSIMASIAQEESRKTSERVKWGQKRRMEQGIVFGRDLLGYRVNNGILSINEDEVPVVKAIFHKYTNEGKGTHIIARELANEGMRPKRIEKWTNTVILRALRNEKYVGDLCQKKTITPNYLTHAKKYNKGEEEMVYLKNHHEPIIDRELWDKTQEELNRRSPSQEQKSKHSNRYWCSGKIVCAECGQKFVSRTKKLKNGHYKAWRCYAAANHGRLKKDIDGNNIGCNNVSINDKSLLSCMKYAINLIQCNSTNLRKEILQEISSLKKASKKNTDSNKLKKKIDSIEIKKRKAIDAMLEGLISKEDFQKQTDWYNQELEQLQQQLLDSSANDKIHARQVNSMEQYITALDEILTFDENNETLYREVLDHIEVHHDHTVDIWLKSVPVGIRLKIRTSGKMEYFKTEVSEHSFIQI